MPTSLPMPMQRGFALLISLALALGALLPLAAPSPTRAAPTELFFSEVVEGLGQNQALEIFNGTATDIDLAAGEYAVHVFYEGAGTVGTTVHLTGTVAAGDVFVLANPAAAAGVVSAADQTVSISWFDGDDAVALVKGTTRLDVIGQIGFDPGSQWGADLTSTADNTIRRLGTVQAGDADGSDAFDPADEWEGFATDTFDGLGSHALTGPAPALWINEFHYDNDGADTGEAIEVAGPAGTDLSGWTLELYNGSGGAIYDTEALAGTIPDVQAGFGMLHVNITGIQNGSPDGIALVHDGAVAQFLSYEGAFTATSGSAIGMLSTDIGVTEPGNTPLGYSLQLVGTGTSYDAFEWAAPQPHTFGALNVGQAFDPNAPTNPTGTGSADPASVEAGQTTLLTVVVTPGTNPDSSGLAVTGDLTSIGGAGAVAFTAAGGTTFVYEATVAADTEPGTKVLPITISDAEGRSGELAIDVVVEEPLEIVPIGSIQGSVDDTDDGLTHRSDFAPASSFQCSDELFLVQGVVTQRIRTETGDGPNYGFFIQNTAGTADGDPNSSDGIFVYTSRFTSIFSDDPDNASGFYFPRVGDEIVLQGRVAEFFNLTQLCNGGLVKLDLVATDRLGATEVIDADPADDLAEANRFWERHEGMRFALPSGARVVGGRSVFASTADAEVWVIRGDHPIAQREDPYTNRVFRDPHVLDDIGPEGSFDNGNGYRIMLTSHGLKWLANDSSVMLDPARTFDTVENVITGSLYFSFGKYAIEAEQQLDLTSGANPSENAAPAAPDREVEYSTAVYNVENLYDFRDDPFDGCDFAGEGNDGCPGVEPPFDYVPASDAAYQQQLANLADQIATDLHGPDIVLVQEAEDQDICTVEAGSLACGEVDDADGKPDTLQELALVLEANHGLPYDAAFDRDGADDRGIVNGFLFRSDRVELLEADADDPVLGDDPQVAYDGAGLGYNADVQNPKALNAELPAGVDLGDGCQDWKQQDGRCVFTRDAQVGLFRVWRDGIGASVFTDVYAITNHFSSGPDGRVEQRTEQAAYNAALVAALASTDDGRRVVVGGDFNVFPRPDDPFPPPGTSDQLAPLYGVGLHDLWAVVNAEAPQSAYSYVFNGQAQTLDNQFTTDELYGELNGVRFAHINADWPASYDGDGSRGASDHDPQAARFDTLPTLERLLDLVDYLVDAGLVSAEVGDAIKDRLIGAAATQSDFAMHRQLDLLERFIVRQTPRHIADAASETLLAELALYRESN